MSACDSTRFLDAETEAILPKEELAKGALAAVHWNTQSSGISIAPEAADELERLWAALLFSKGEEVTAGPEEVSTPERYFEGATRRVSVSVYERSGFARRRCIEHYGARCSVCEFDFETAYGQLGAGFIHVHHVVPISSIGEFYQLDPIKDLRPVCPNCHAMLHRSRSVMSIQALRDVLR